MRFEIRARFEIRVRFAWDSHLFPGCASSLHAWHKKRLTVYVRSYRLRPTSEALPQRPASGGIFLHKLFASTDHICVTKRESQIDPLSVNILIFTAQIWPQTVPTVWNLKKVPPRGILSQKHKITVTGFLSKVDRTGMNLSKGAQRGSFEKVTNAVIK